MNKRPFWIRSLPPWEDDDSRDWRVKALKTDVPTPMGKLSVYYSTLKAGCQPHELQSHVDDEFLIITSGELDVVTAEVSTAVGPGSFSFHPSGHLHTIRCSPAGPVGFLIIRFALDAAAPALTPIVERTLVADARQLQPWEERSGGQRQWLSQGHPLTSGGKFRAHTARFAANSGQHTHFDRYDGMLVLLQGTLHGVGHMTPAPAVIFYPSGVAHGCAPVNAEPWQALCFEFHHPPPAG